MASGTLAGFMSGVVQHDKMQARLRKLGLTARQLELNRYWSYYTCCQHDHKTVNWDGSRVMDHVELQTMGHTAYLPPGFYDATGSADEMPLMIRKPVAPYHLTRVVVNRFTGLLFSAKKHPQIHVPGDPAAQSWIEALIKASRLWIRWAHARTFGGAQGSVAVSFRFRNGKPLIEVHDPRWCTPTFVDIATGEISALEIRYMYPVDERQPDGDLKQVWYWYRRVIDQAQDVVFKPAPVGEGDKAGIEPVWIPQSRSAHGFGECPAVWVRNTQTDEMDGEPDCQGEFDTQDAIDRLISQADQGAVENADPTLGIVSDELKVAELKKGSRNAVKVERGGSLNYVEASGSGIKVALEVADVHRRNFLEVVQCVLDNDDNATQMTATEVERRREPMHERGDLFREQYGEHGVKPLLGKMVRAILKMRGGSQQFDQVTGLRIVPHVVLPAVGGKVPDVPTGLTTITDDTIELVWPDWVKRGAQDAQAAAGAVATARSAQAIDQESAVQYIAPFFGIDDPAEALRRLKEEGGAADAGMVDPLMQAAQGPLPPPGGDQQDPAQVDPADQAAAS